MTIDPKTRRDAAVSRVRRATAAVLAGSAALTGAFFGLAAGSTHSTAKGPTTAKTKSTGTVTAPTPTLTQNGSDNSSPPVQQTPTPSVAQSAPVVVSGGS